jgi:hypothetical protein
MAFFGLCKRRIQKWRFFNFPGPPRGFLQKKGKKWQKMAKNDPFFDLFLGQKVPGFQGFWPKNEGQKWPSFDLKEVGPEVEGLALPSPSSP